MPPRARKQPNSDTPREEEPAEEAGSSQCPQCGMSEQCKMGCTLQMCPPIDWDAVLLADAAKGEAVEAELELAQIEAAEAREAEAEAYDVKGPAERVRTFWDDVIRRMGGDPDADD